MADTYELKFREDLFKKYNTCKKYLIPKDIYLDTIEQCKVAARDASAKSRHEYYILSK